ncbi:TetR/AcrR family transcriptional regulator [Amycolatopsis magusensis]|uniref:AcrR family transcriptional regulator n=1 Tax=Amycolatopsis magusensis TaxID=882444 RepID=A0ABS4PS82_9PSEU|nr:TetR/AcrR family transcriptional regulator [Amycolatopsis magusensis]MBP2182277.1 AcrR family transcriptional regulator [Amycolatopsis magusensis]MDI5976648.1 TetR/AcrR family transcriptional regulator [Amycolatopsis magusensis]
MAAREGAARSAAETRERFLRAAIRVLAEQGVAGLTVRNLAEAAGSSTIGVYSRFGGRAGVLDALYERAFEQLDSAFAALPPRTGDRARDVLELALTYRRFALENPARYAFMFERPVADFDPDPALRLSVLRASFTQVIERARPAEASEEDGRQYAYLLWTTMHGLISVELTNAARTQLQGWFVAPDERAREEIYRAGVGAITCGLDARFSA